MESSVYVKTEESVEEKSSAYNVTLEDLMDDDEEFSDANLNNIISD